MATDLTLLPSLSTVSVRRPPSCQPPPEMKI